MEHFLRVAALAPERLEQLLELSAACKRDPLLRPEALRGETVACFFEKPSTRTRASLHTAITRLGGSPLFLRPDELQLGRGEPVSDTARVLSSYTAAIVARVYSQAMLEELAAAASVPVVNALSDLHHPCQALADLLTLRERFGSLRGLRAAFVGAGNNVCHSFLEAGALAGMEIAVAAPAGLAPDAELVAAAQRTAEANGGSVEVTDDPYEAVAGAAAVYTDVWVSMGEDAEGDVLRRRLEPYRVDAPLLAAAADEAIFLHCLPAHRGEEVAADVIDGPRSAVWQQAANRLPTAQAVLLALTSGRWAAPAPTPLRLPADGIFVAPL